MPEGRLLHGAPSRIRHYEYTHKVVDAWLRVGPYIPQRFTLKGITSHDCSCHTLIPCLQYAMESRF